MKKSNSQSKRSRARIFILTLVLAALTLSAASCDVVAPRTEESENQFNFQTGPLRSTSDAEEADPPEVINESASSETSAATQAQTDSATKRETTAVTESAAPTLGMRDEPFAGRKVPLYLQTGDETQNEEPAVPLSLPLENPIRGISGYRVERFFKTLSTNPVYYHYAVIPGEDVPEDEPVTEVLVVLNGDRSYLRIDTLSGITAVLSKGDGQLYQLDLVAGNYEVLPDNTSFKKELSMEAYRSLEANAAHFIATGTGEAIFYGRKVIFEEFTPDGSLYIRYYFVGDALVGHRSFQGGKILQTVKVEETSNRTDMSVFEIPENFEPVKSGETVATTVP